MNRPKESQELTNLDLGSLERVAGGVMCPCMRYFASMQQPSSIDGVPVARSARSSPMASDPQGGFGMFLANFFGSAAGSFFGSWTARPSPIVLARGPSFMGGRPYGRFIV